MRGHAFDKPPLLHELDVIDVTLVTHAGEAVS
jgi:hypothetical protein